MAAEVLMLPKVGSSPPAGGPDTERSDQNKQLLTAFRVLERGPHTPLASSELTVTLTSPCRTVYASTAIEGDRRRSRKLLPFQKVTMAMKMFQ
jgi:hypothetical protein